VAKRPRELPPESKLRPRRIQQITVRAAGVQRMPAVHQADKEAAVVDWLFRHFHLDQDISSPNFHKQMSGGRRFSHPGR
jgi:hypothetical protein